MNARKQSLLQPNTTFIISKLMHNGGEFLKVERALISVSDKKGIAEFARSLKELGVEILSTGGTARLLREEGLQVINVSDYTNFPEMLDGRVKTLHPKIHGGILALRNNAEHMIELREHGILPIDMVVINLYPFEDTVSKENVGLHEAIENIDIGGPTMIRSAAKNYEGVAVIVNPSRYDSIINELREKGCALSTQTLMSLAVEAFKYTSAYDTVIYNYLFKKAEKGYFPDGLRLRYEKVQDLRYGENPNQKAAFYKDPDAKGVCVSNSEKLHGKELSFNNILDLDSALDILREFKKPASAVIKHTNPCGVACADSISDAYIKAHACDPVSAFGSVVGLNRAVDKATAVELSKHFVEAVIAPDYDNDALEILRKKKNIRLLRTGKPIVKERAEDKMMKVRGGMLVQTGEFAELDERDLKVVTEREPTAEELKGLIFAWRVIRHIKSNAILLVKGEETVGIGAGQMSRVDSAMIAGHKAGERAKGSVLASDAFFPFRDGVDEVAKVGATAIIQPGGSVRDEEVIKAANEHQMAMIFTGSRLFKH